MIDNDVVRSLRKVIEELARRIRRLETLEHTGSTGGGSDHDAVTVADTTTVDMEVTGQTISAEVIPSGIKLDDFASPDDNTDLNASTAAHGLLPKLDDDPTHYLDGQGNWTVPSLIEEAMGLNTPVLGTYVDQSSKIEIVNDSSHNGYPGVEVLADGTIIVVYRKGVDRSTTKGALYMRTSTNGGTTWSAAALVYSDATYDVRHSSIRRLRNGNLILSFGKRNNDTTLIYRGCYVSISTDNGATWGAPIQIPDEFTQTSFLDAPVVELPNGDLILGIYGKDIGGTYSYARLVKSIDGGTTWTDEGVLCQEAGNVAFPNILRLENGELLCMMYAGGGVYSTISRSIDGGYSWSTPVHVFPVLSAPHMLRASNGAILIVYRDPVNEYAAYRISLDNGYNWGSEVIFDSNTVSMLYGSIVEYETGIVGIVYGMEIGVLNGTDADLFWKRIYTTLEAGQLESKIPVGTAPLIVASTTLVTNLNADLLDNSHATDFATASHVHIDTAVAMSPLMPAYGSLLALGSKVTIVNNSSHNGFPSVTMLQDGTIMVVYRVATHHSSTQGVIYKQTSTDGGATWNAAAIVHSHASYDARDPSITCLKNGDLIISFFYAEIPSGARMGTYTLLSTDDGVTWGSPVSVSDSFTDYACVSAPVIEMPNGSLLLPIYGEDSGGTYRYTRLVKSVDGGATWTDEGIINNSSRDLAEPNLVLLPNGELVGMIRSHTPSMLDGHFWQVRSTDGGLSWSAELDTFEGSGAPRMMVASNGALLLLYRKTSDDSLIMVYRISLDGGHTWEAETTLDATAGTMVYAAAVEYEIGIIGIVYGLEPGGDVTDSNLYWVRLYTTLEAGQLESKVPIGTAPLVVVSTTVVTNLNADLLDGNHATAFAVSDHTHEGSAAILYEILVDDEGGLLLDDDYDVVYEG